MKQKFLRIILTHRGEDSEVRKRCNHQLRLSTSYCSKHTDFCSTNTVYCQIYVSVCTKINDQVKTRISDEPLGEPKYDMMREQYKPTKYKK